MRVRETALPGVLVIEPVAHGDGRGYFLETWKAPPYDAAIGALGFVQDNLSRSARGVLRGLHYQTPREQGKLVWAVRGRVFDVAVDVRRGSPAFGRWAGVELSDDNHLQLWIPPGFAHGFLTLSEQADVAYKCTETFAPDCDRAIRWDDPEIGIAWPDCGLPEPLLSNKDARAPRLAEAVLPGYDLPS